MKLGTKLTRYLSLIIILVLSGYGYFDILSRRDILINKMKTVEWESKLIKGKAGLVSKELLGSNRHWFGS